MSNILTFKSVDDEKPMTLFERAMTTVELLNVQLSELPEEINKSAKPELFHIKETVGMILNSEGLFSEIRQLEPSALLSLLANTLALELPNLSIAQYRAMNESSEDFIYELGFFSWSMSSSVRTLSTMRFDLNRPRLRQEIDQNGRVIFLQERSDEESNWVHTTVNRE